MQGFVKNLFTKRQTLVVAILIFIFSFLIHFLPVYLAGYSPAVDSENLILARNLALSGKPMIESDLNVYLSPQVLATVSGLKANTNSQLTPLIYSHLFKIFGFNKNLPLVFSLVCWSLICALIFILFKQWFNFFLGLICSLVAVFTPIFWWASIQLGFYEWAALFFVLGLFLYFYPKESSLITLALAGVFFALAIVCRNAFIISVFIVIVFSIYHQRSVKKLVYLSLPVIIIVGGIFYLDIQSGTNAYLSPAQNKSFSEFAHLFPDPYTYHFNQQNYLDTIKNKAEGDVASVIISQGGYGGKELLEKYFGIFINSFNYYLRQMIRPTILGGPIIIILMILGLIYLFKSNRTWLYFSGFWLMALFSALIFLRTSNSDHFLEIIFVVSLLVGFGFYSLASIAKNSLSKKYYYLTLIFLSLITVANYFFVDCWMFYREYKGDNLVVQAQPIIKSVNQNSLDPNKDILAVNIHPSMVGIINYYTSANIIYFDSQTIEDLLTANKLKEAFNYFGVTAVASYSEDLTNKISQVAPVKIIK
jgi:hypothetical protein